VDSQPFVALYQPSWHLFYVIDSLIHSPGRILGKKKVAERMSGLTLILSFAPGAAHYAKTEIIQKRRKQKRMSRI
jgi:hypothetical protein